MRWKSRYSYLLVMTYYKREEGVREKIRASVIRKPAGVVAKG